MGKHHRHIVVPESRQKLAQMKYEIAQQFGLYDSHTGAHTEFATELGHITAASHTGYWGHLTSRQNGSIGGEMTKRLVQQAQQHLSAQSQTTRL